MPARKSLFLVAAIALMLASALAVIVNKYQTRLLFIEIQKQEQLMHGYAVKWGQLQLELTTLTEENRIEKVAKQQLKLAIPQREKIIYLKP